MLEVRSSSLLVPTISPFLSRCICPDAPQKRLRILADVVLFTSLLTTAYFRYFPVCSDSLFIMRFFLSLSCFFAFAGLTFAQNPKPVADHVAAQNALFEEQYESDLKNFPERATAFGDYRYNDKLTDYSLEAITQRNKTNQEFLVRLKAIGTTGFSDQDQLSHDLMMRVLQQRITDYSLKEYEMPINQQNGIHTSLADLPNSVPFTTVKQYEDYVSRLHQVPRVLSRRRRCCAPAWDKLMPVRLLLEKIPVQCQGIIDANPFCYLPRVSGKHFTGRAEAPDAADHRGGQQRGYSCVQPVANFVKDEALRRAGPRWRSRRCRMARSVTKTIFTRVRRRTSVRMRYTRSGYARSTASRPR